MASKNRYPGRCSRAGCGREVPAGSGFVGEKVGGRPTPVYCQAHRADAGWHDRNPVEFLSAGGMNSTWDGPPEAAKLTRTNESFDEAVRRLRGGS